MLEVDIDHSGTVDFFEFLCVARLISQGKGAYKASAPGGKIKEYTTAILSLLFKSHCLRKPGRGERWGSADFLETFTI